MDIQEVIKEIKKGKSQSQLAKELNVSQPAISQVLSRAGYCPACLKKKNEVLP